MSALIPVVSTPIVVLVSVVIVVVVSAEASALALSLQATSVPAIANTAKNFFIVL
ncbi:MAG: hypothetical protein ACO1NX_00425 [Chitinophagaceae bacterium]